VFSLDGLSCVRLADEGMPNVTIAGDGRWGIGRVTEPYRGDVAWGGGRADHYRVNLATGDRSLITLSLSRAMGSSPDGRWFLFLKARQVWAEDLDTGTKVNLSKGAPVDFVNEDDDHPYEKPAWGVAGWTSDGSAVILNHRFDLWLCPLNGNAATNITVGVGDAEQIRFRYTTLDPDAETIDTSAPLLLTAYGEWTKKSGYYTVEIGSKPEALFFVDKSVGRPIVAKDADRVVLTLQTFEDFPDYWVTNTRFENPIKVTDANPQQSEYSWGRRVLVDYENQRGVPLQATLALPGGYEEGKKYPMLVYFYEKMSQRHHQYSMPQFDDRPHMSTYASDGYLVLMPDVVYLPGLPGDCATDCVTSAVQQVIDLGYADPERIVLQGHSWGGYQSSFILTQTDMFAAVVTGAPVTNLVSFYDELYKSSGNVQQGITEVGQVRMGTTPWDNMELFHSQSPLHNVRNITTPFIILHGTEDGSVDWHQGLEYYNAAKRNGKEVILLSYPGEGHHLSNRANQIDFLTRMKQFFDHYAKGTEAPKWMKKGVPFLEKGISSPNGIRR
jgi:acetyl esterase/lipase